MARYNKAYKELIKADLVDSYATKMYREHKYRRCPICNQLRKLSPIINDQPVCAKCYEKDRVKRLSSKTKNIRKKKK